MELKKSMTIEEMAEHMKEHTFRLPNRVTIGLYAKKLGYQVYKPMRDGKLLHLYVLDEDLQKD